MLWVEEPRAPNLVTPLPGAAEALKRDPLRLLRPSPPQSAWETCTLECQSLPQARARQVWTGLEIERLSCFLLEMGKLRSRSGCSIHLK